MKVEAILREDAVRARFVDLLRRRCVDLVVQWGAVAREEEQRASELR